MRPILDPDDAENSPIAGGPLGELRGLFELPRRVREFGYYPAIDQLKPGDLLLFAAKEPKYLARKIVKFQRDVLEPEHARWTHAAIYIYDNVLIESTPIRGAAISFLSRYVPGFEILVRRGDPADVDESVQSLIVFNAIVKLPRLYSLLSILEVAYRLAGIGRNVVGLTANFNMCSRLFADAWQGATELPLEGCQNRRVITPAHLSKTPTLNDVKVQWIKISESTNAPRIIPASGGITRGR